MKNPFNFCRLKQLCFTVTFSVASLTLNGQEPGMSITYPKVIPPSPDAQTFIRYGEIPVDYCSGIPKIEIPLYEIKSGSLTLPISLTYHTSIKVNDISGVVGLGWKLNAGGVFTRTVKGRPDESSLTGILVYGQLTKSEIDNAPLDGSIFATLNRISKGAQDNESDNYFYSTGDGLSGQFVYDHLNNMVPLSYTTDKVSKYATSAPNYGSHYYEVIRDNGAIYTFKDIEITTEEEHHPSSWWLSSIISSDKSDTISFEYEKAAYRSTDFFMSERWAGATVPGVLNEGFDRFLTTINTDQLLLKKIKFRNGYVKFDYSDDRKDGRHNRLTFISIFSVSDNKLIKKYGLDHKYFYSGWADNMFNYRLKLNALNVYDSNGSFVNNYTFHYNEEHILPPSVNPASLHDIYPRWTAVDFWGYYNGADNNQYMLPYIPSPRVGANRTPNIDYAKSCVLNKITYPTGGYTSFEYEANQKADYTIIGGIRVSRITSQADQNSNAIVKRYEYGNNLLTTELNLDDLQNYRYDQQHSTRDDYCTDYWITVPIYMSNSIIPLLNHNGNTAIYQEVFEYTDGANGSLKTRYFYEAENDIVYSVESPRYQNEYFIERPWRKGLLASTYFYKLIEGTYKDVKSISTIYGDYKTNTIITGTKVQRINIYTRQGCSSDVLGDYYPANTPWINLFYYFDTNVEVGIKKPIKQITTEYDENHNMTSVVENYTYGAVNHLYPTQIDYTDSKNEKSVILLKYPYDFAGTNVYDVMVGKNIISPAIEKLEYKGTGTSYPLLSTKTNYGFYQNNKIIAPSTVDTKKGSESYEPRLTYHDYDNRGNILSVSKTNDVKESYLWGYNQAYPIARAVNATPAQLAYTSFEDANEKGRWEFTYSSSNTCNSTCTSAATSAATQAYNSCISSCNTSCGANQSCYSTCRDGCQSAYNGVYSQVYNSCMSGCQDNAKVGNQYFGGSSVSISSLPYGNYKVGCWIKKTGSSDGIFNVNGTSNTISASTWQYKEFTVNSATSVTLTLTGVGIDELRLCPQSAQMTTYTYKPLVGVTSAADENGQVTYYEYDSFGRLKTIKDSAGNILKSYDYHYKQ